VECDRRLGVPDEELAHACSATRNAYESTTANLAIAATLFYGNGGREKEKLQCWKKLQTGALMAGRKSVNPKSGDGMPNCGYLSFSVLVFWGRRMQKKEIFYSLPGND
jgi:hypothetical protein